ncbi:GroES-like protein [Aspergillus taichungensis]|uniref:GroES-like protein n=1 Tax=Aspergillus taichungensis TaxID=482145 RepID=A0A2J5I1S4_9EURO|nr:GroES-like protein [Aspergillus taichungensis]
MRAIVYSAPNTITVEERPAPTLKHPTDAIIRMQHSSICGTDLHILQGDVATARPGLILGHEGVGVVHSLGSAVSGLAPGDQVILSCVSACGVCPACRGGLYSHCEDDEGGWILGNTIDGMQAEYVRVPHARSSLFKLGAHGGEQAVQPRTAALLSDAFPTALECGVKPAGVKPASSVVVIGAGPVGLAAAVMARSLYAPSLVVVVDRNAARLEMARALGAAHEVVDCSGEGGDEEALGQLRILTEGKGFDSVIEAVGVPGSFEMAQEVVAVGGAIANVGVHGKKVDLHLERLWDRNISIHASLVDTTSTPMLLRLFESGQLDGSPLITHVFPFSQAEQAYATCRAAAKEKAMKIIIDID